MLSKLAKEALRSQFLEKRKGLSNARREQAAQLSFTHLKQWIEDFSSSKETAVLSFAPFRDEIDIWPLNRWLLKERKLLLPRMEKEHLSLYQVDSLQDLKPSIIGILEPDPDKAQYLLASEVDIVLVPGIAFDNEMHRLGYGKGYYDKLLHTLRPATPKIGIGFKETLSLDPLPFQSHDIPLTHRFLF